MKAIELKLTPVVSSLEKSGVSVTALTESFAQLESSAIVEDKVLLTLLKLFAQRHGLSTVTSLTAPTFYQKLLVDCKDGGLDANFNEEDVKNFVRREIRETQRKDHAEFKKQMVDRARGGAGKKSG
ncbi:hypothetical protein M5689_002361 [Euphorbia peplus]|nr:hypothetical protein M5689_002361 [Euphorbia peplus]